MWLRVVARNKVQFGMQHTSGCSDPPGDVKSVGQEYLRLSSIQEDQSNRCLRQRLPQLGFQQKTFSGLGTIVDPIVLCYATLLLEEAQRTMKAYQLGYQRPLARPGASCITVPKQINETEDALRGGKENYHRQRWRPAAEERD